MVNRELCYHCIVTVIFLRLCWLRFLASVVWTYPTNVQMLIKLTF